MTCLLASNCWPHGFPKKLISSGSFNFAECSVLEEASLTEYTITNIARLIVPLIFSCSISCNAVSLAPAGKVATTEKRSAMNQDHEPDATPAQLDDDIGLEDILNDKNSR